jgi:hypothetical protein
LAWIFGRPEYDISFHVNTDSADLIGTDTFINNEVRLRKGSIYQCAEFGGFGILDEINMAKNDAVSVLHATLDHRRRINIPGYNRILLHPATRFIGRPNIGGYACYLDFAQICASSMPDTAGFHITGNPLHICLCLCCFTQFHF